MTTHIRFRCHCGERHDWWHDCNRWLGGIGPDSVDQGSRTESDAAEFERLRNLDEPDPDAPFDWREAE